MSVLRDRILGDVRPTGACRDCKREPEKAVPERQKSDVGIPEAPTNMCEYCSKLFGRMSDLRRHIRRTHTQVIEYISAVSVAVPSTLSCDELGPDPDIEILAEDGDFSPTPMELESVIKRKPTRPPPVVSGLKAPLVSLTGQSFDFGDKIMAKNITTVLSKTVTVETAIVPERKKHKIAGEIKSLEQPVISSAAAVSDSVTATGKVGKRSYGVQVNFSKIEHHRVVETVKVYKEGDAEITKKEVHERFVE